jgi:predicted cupin superfamily sugar epimerase
VTAADVIARLNLQRHPLEGGYFIETYRSAETLPAEVLPRNGGPRSIGTAIYYLLTPDAISAMHRLPTDEVFHFYRGDPLEMLLLTPDGQGRFIELGSDVLAGQHPQVVVPGGVWQGSILKPGGRFALIGATMAPGFDYHDYVHGDPAVLGEQYPAFADAIRRRSLPASAGS